LPDFKGLLREDPVRLAETWKNLGMDSIFSVKEFNSLNATMKFEFLAEFLRLKIPAQLLEDLADMLIIRVILGERDLHFLNWVQLDGRGIGIDLAGTNRLISAEIQDEFENPLDVPWRSLCRLYFPSASTSVLDRLSQLSRHQLQSWAQKVGYNLSEQEVTQDLLRRDHVFKIIESLRQTKTLPKSNSGFVRGLSFCTP